MSEVFVVGGTTSTSYVSTGDEWDALIAQGTPLSTGLFEPTCIVRTADEYLIGADTGRVLWSATGASGTWTVVNTGLTGDITAMAVFGSVVIAVDDTGGLATSSAPRTTWAASGSEFGSAVLNEIAVSDDVVLVVGQSGVVQTSTTGLAGSFTSRTLGTYPSSTGLRAAYLPELDLFVIGGQGGRTWSMDPDDLTTITYRGNPGERDCQGFAFDGTTILMVSGTSGAEFRISTSTTGLSWTYEGLGPVSQKPRAALYDQIRKTWVVCGNSGSLVTAPSATGPWTSQAAGFTDAAYQLYANTSAAGTISVPPEGTTFSPPRGHTQLLVRHHPEAEIWSAETTLIERDAWPGTVTPNSSNTGGLRGVAEGSYDALGSSLFVLVREAGYPGSGLALNLRIGSTDYGSDAWHIIDDRAPIRWNGSADIGCVDVTSVGRTAIAVTGSDPATTGGAVFLWTRDSRDAEWAGSGLAISLGASTTANYPTSPDRGPHPAVCTLPDGRVLLVVERYGRNASAENVWFDSYIAPVDASWDSSPFDLSSAGSSGLAFSSVLTVSGLRMEASSGQVLLLAGYFNSSGGTSHTLYQYASADGGSTFRQVTGTTTGIALRADDSCSFDVARIGPFFIVAFIDDNDDLVVIRTADATDFLGDLQTITVSSATYSGGVAVVAAEDGSVLLYAQVPTTFTTAVFRSVDGGITWDAGSVLFLGASDQPSISACRWRHQVVLGMTTEGAASFGESVVAYTLGGWSTWTMPTDRNKPGDRIEWGGVWAGNGLPTTAPGGHVISTTGAPSVDFRTDGTLEVDVGAGELFSWNSNTSFYSYTPATSALQSRCRVESGSIDHEIGLNGGYAFWVRQTNTALAIYDDIGGSLVQSVVLDTNTLYDVVMTIDHVAGTAAVQYAAISAATPLPSTARTYTTIDVTPSSYASTTVNRSVLNENTVAAYQHHAWGEWEDTYALAPDEPYTRQTPAAPIHLIDGVQFTARGGPGYADDLFAITPASETPSTYAAATPFAPSPRLRFETSGTTAGYIAWQLGSNNSDRECPIWCAWVETNASRVRLDWYVEGTGWVTGPWIKDELRVSMTIRGRHVVADANRYGVDYVEDGELTGGHVYSLTSGEWLPVERNTDGLLQYQATAKLARLVVADGNHGDDVSLVSFPRSLCIMDSATVPANVRGVRLYLGGGTGAPAEGRWHVKTVIGPALMLGLPHGRDARLSAVPSPAVGRAANGVTYVHEQAPTIRRLRASWQNEPDPFVYQTWRSTTPPAVIVDSQGEPLYSRGSMASTLLAKFDELAGTGVPVVYVQRCDPAAGLVVHQAHRAGGSLLARLGGEYLVEHGGHGDEGVNPTIRGGEVELEEIS